MPLFTPGDLGQALQEDVDEAAAVQAERVAAGWLRYATRLEVWPDPLPEELYAWGLVLGGEYYTNPERYTSATAPDVAYGYGTVADVLGAAKEWAARRRGENPDNPPAGPVAAAPRFSFPRPAWGETDYVRG